jgi:pimeloyl-ACP methyl ester carboxylesterase
MAYWKADDGTLIHHEVFGLEGEKGSLLLLPGLLGSISSQWRAFIKPLASAYRVVIADLRGHGRSTNETEELRPDRMTRDILGLLDHLEVDAVHLAGYDFGGYLGLMSHLYRPQQIKSLMVFATRFFWTRKAAARMGEQLDPDVMGATVPSYANRLALEHGGSHWRALVRQAADLVEYLVEEGITEGMAARAQCPVLVCVGDRDELVPLQEAQRLSRIFSNGSLLVLPGTRHPFQTARLVPLLPTMQEFHT